MKDERKVENVLDVEVEALPVSDTEKMKARVVLAAAWYLRKHDFIILDTGWKCNFGEVDIVAMEDGCLTFIEVNEVKGEFKADAKKVSNKKRAKYENIACAYLISHDFSDLPMRFDIIEIKKLDKDRCMVGHHVNAFGVA